MDDDVRKEQSGAGDYGATQPGDEPQVDEQEGTPTGETAGPPPGGPEHQPRGGGLTEGARDMPGEGDTLSGEGLGGDGSEGSPG